MGYPDVASGPLSPIPLDPGMNPGTAGRRWTERPAGWRTAPVRSQAPTGRATSATSGGRSAHTDTGRAVAVGASSASGSLIGDALLRELLENGLPARRAEPSRVSGVSDTVVFELDPRHDSTVAASPVLPVRDPARTPRTRRRTGVTARRRGHGTRAGRARLDRAGAAPLDTRRHQHNGHGRPPGSTGATAPEGPAADHGGNPGDSPDAGSPGAGTPGPGASSRPPGAARSATSDTDGLGLGDLLAGALAAYRNI